MDQPLLRPGERAPFGVEFALRLGALALLLYWAFVLVRPFVSIIIWSVVIAVALYPAYESMARAMNGRRRIAAAVLTVVSFLVVIGPTVWIAFGLIESVQTLAERLDPALLTVPPPPLRVRHWFLVGEPLYQFWELASTNLQAAVAKLAPQLKPVGTTLLGVAAGAGIGVLKFFTALLVAGFLFPIGPLLAQEFRLFARRLAGDRGEEFVALAGATIRSISLGVIGVSALQALLTGLAFLVFGVPGAGLVTTVVLLLGIAQIGPSIVLLGAAIWSWTAMDGNSALLFTGTMVVIGLIDNVLRPFVMTRGGQAPMPVILIGVLGGTLAYGITGLFLGPVVLAVLWKLLLAWIEAREEA
jgi:predicted PurR-regulated permease PerM